MRILDAICACLLLFCFSPAYPYKVVVLVLDISNSQLLFNKRVAEALAEAGHDVTLALISPQADRDSSDIKIASSVRGEQRAEIFDSMP
ncbi:unnamed protein product [Nippostrongylus brasiliensis]|uniref:Glucuronosyltransferase n=1 Tax=Nippostrongylus brasiliensis TaxID=27835 RepID=A0A0N4YYQ4_NIPBR|nr:unnamed protein product [Nippostrongylus brasiliensis]